MCRALHDCLEKEKANKVPRFEILDSQVASATGFSMSVDDYKTPPRLEKKTSEEQESEEKHALPGCKKRLYVEELSQPRQSKRLRSLGSEDLAEVSQMLSEMDLASRLKSTEVGPGPVAASPSPVAPEALPEQPKDPRDVDPPAPVSPSQEDPAPVSPCEEDPSAPVSPSQEDPPAPVSPCEEDPAAPVSPSDEVAQPNLEADLSDYLDEMDAAASSSRGAAAPDAFALVPHQPAAHDKARGFNQ